LGSAVTLIDPEGNLTPFGPAPKRQRFRVTGIFETNFFDVDDSWAYASLASVQRLRSLNDVVNAIEIRLDDPNLAPAVGKEALRLAGNRYSAETWEEQ